MDTKYLEIIKSPVITEKSTKLSQEEYWLLIYAFVEDRMRENICMKLNIGKTKYHSILNEALIKVDYTINNLDKIRTL